MINYIWIGLIIIAVIYAGYRDISGDAVKSTPSPVTVVLGEEEVIRIEYSTESEPDRHPMVAPLTSDSGAPNALLLSYRGEGGGNLLVAEISDADGEQFLSPFSKRLSDSDGWTSGTFTLTSLIAAPQNPAATVDKPLKLEALHINPSASADQKSGKIQIRDVAMLFPGRSKVDDNLDSTSWMGVLTKSSARWAEISINLAIDLIGIMMFWLGLMRIAEAAGLVQALARALKPIMTRLFPELPPEGEAMGAIIMNVAANMLGLGNAATPLGLKAMEELQKVNKNKEYASNAMCMLLSLNTASVTIIPPAIIGYRAAAGSTDIMKFWPVMIASTCISTVFAVTACKILEKLPAFQIPTTNSEEANNS